MRLPSDIIYAIASRALADVKSVRKWDRGVEARKRMKPAVVRRIENAARSLGVIESEARPPA